MDGDYFTITPGPVTTGTDGVPESHVALTGEFDLNARDILREALVHLLDTAPSRRIIVDLTNVTFIDSEAIGAILEGLIAAQKVSKTLQLANANRQIQRVFDVIGMNDLLRDPHHW
ncbi:STAS domain-containing protein [Actinoplanes couchii]|uniref:Anti-sigma factor antagonist n=1 Tax=Actinoplanes couchii TaxID=403638 RepID=A0ABQ3XUD9_9ACTN|nr:STAS domain-containing protein [Actinoplanes couchii]MDR6324540.1 anti-sigma B factor antagonist [Actinoplanes couchii]GID62101.1 hypothetical protein Aco03nite_105050 [Actinoplanes couchii]